ncbi:diguanylate cyclase [bacterium]|nr:MAG: diguanylate cyclase [bacterium]
MQTNDVRAKQPPYGTDTGKEKILIVDDDAFFRATISDVLTSIGGFNVVMASCGDDALFQIQKDPHIAIVLTDLSMPGMSGIEVLERTKQYNALIDVIVVTGHGTIETAIECLKKGAFDYIRKPVNDDELIHTINICMEKRHFLEENKDLRHSLKLFEVSRSVLSVIDLTRLYIVSLDAMFQVVPAEAGLLAFYDGIGADAGLNIHAIKNIGMAQVEALLETFKHESEKKGAGAHSITVIPVRDMNEACRAAFGKYTSLMMVPVARNASITGYFFLLGALENNVFSQQDVSSAVFMMEHASLAFENAQKYSDAKDLALIDSLTGLYNSAYLDIALDRELKRAARQVTPVTVLFLDLDNFKRINDAHDHLTGSRLLVEIAKILLQSVREMDTVVRYGGDEFVVVLPDTGFDKGFKVAERIRATIEFKNFFHDDDLDIRITASIGMAAYPIHAKGKIDLLRIADKAMYRAKDVSKNAVYLAPLPEDEEQPAKTDR